MMSRKAETSGTDRKHSHVPRIGIIAVGYNRVASYRRLIDSLCMADYGDDRADLILSIDHSDSRDVLEYAKSVSWDHGEKIIRYFEDHQGLKKHILQCGDYLRQGYDAVVVLEDDIMVSPAFYHYTRQCVAEYRDEEEIAGISLYSHLMNVHCLYPFQPHSSAYDVYFMQFAQSWGQIWMKKQWNSFLTWIEEHGTQFPMTPEIPPSLGSWGEDSWLKYHIRYCIETGHYFVYPYNSLTTCFAEVGTHSIVKDLRTQVPMQLVPVVYRLPAAGAADAVYYDAFFERQRKEGALPGADFFTDDSIAPGELTVDLYGQKSAQDGLTHYLLTDRHLPFRPIRSFGRELRPQEDNVTFGIEGNDLFLYDMQNKTVGRTGSGFSGSHSGERSPSVADCLKRHGIRKFIYFFRITAHTADLIRTAGFLAFSLVSQKRSALRKQKK